MVKQHPLIHEAEREASQLCRYYQIRKTHDGVMVWRFTNQWIWHRPFPTKDEAAEYLFNKLPVIESEL